MFQNSASHDSAEPSTMNCRGCDRNISLRYCKYSNPNGNEGRPYFACDGCDKFWSFANERGVLKDNPYCDCESPTRTRQQVTGQNKKTPGMLHTVCSSGQCDHFSWVVDYYENPIIIDRDLIRPMAECMFI
ncbi:hypothetical protein F4806DRAFT_69899 [Annulohypoxylon nitens]|nr:hypothetical protein F4806DRAFT_69899 [Annulohypoxylon nitens]